MKTQMKLEDYLLFMSSSFPVCWFPLSGTKGGGKRMGSGIVQTWVQILEPTTSVTLSNLRSLSVFCFFPPKEWL